MITAPLAAAGCIFLFFSLSKETQLLFLGWAIVGLVVYFLYGYRTSRTHQCDHLGKNGFRGGNIDHDQPLVRQVEGVSQQSV